ncbi:2-isopropylmalate synthase [Rhodoferax sp.]|uniref:2-isopropylmalate synthase n=1 Tax=Rhodoferax sp. TaxID=50421 RepID=UPI00374D585B
MLKQPASKYPAFKPVALADRTWPNVQLTQAPIWLSTDLRDGNQALIEPMDMARKLRMFEHLLQIGFKEIEVGFPAASQIEFDFVRRLIDNNMVPDDVTIQVMTPAKEPLIRRTMEALVGAKRAIVHMYNATSPLMRRVVLGMDEDQIVELAISHARQIQELARQQPATHWTFQYSPEHFSGTELAFSKRVIDAVTDVWQPTPAQPCIVNLPTTVEHSTPNVFADMIEWMDRNLARRDSIVLSVHPHNDRGTGVAAAELALMAGAQRVEGCLFGNGERTGNVDIVNIALNLYTQGVSPDLDFSQIDDIRSMVEHCNQLPVHPRHPYVGELVYTSFSGTHQDAIKKAFALHTEDAVWAIPYLPIDPKDLGRSYEAVIRVNSQSGKGGMAYLLETEYGLELPRRLQIEFSQIVQAVMDGANKELTAQDLWELFQREYGTARITAPAVPAAGQGVGPIDAFVNQLNAAGATQVRVLDYHEHAMGAGANAQAVAYLELRIDEQHTVFGVGMDANIVSASLKAIISGVQRAQKRSASGENAQLAESAPI